MCGLGWAGRGNWTYPLGLGPRKPGKGQPGKQNHKPGIRGARGCSQCARETDGCDGILRGGMGQIVPDGAALEGSIEIHDLASALVGTRRWDSCWLGF